MTDEVEVLRANFNAAKNALDVTRDAFLQGVDADTRVAYLAAREQYRTALRRFFGCGRSRGRRGNLVTDHPRSDQANTLVPVQVGMTLVEAQNLLIKATLQWTDGNIKRAAAVLGIDRSTLQEKIKRHGLR